MSVIPQSGEDRKWLITVKSVIYLIFGVGMVRRTSVYAMGFSCGLFAPTAVLFEIEQCL